MSRQKFKGVDSTRLERGVTRSSTCYLIENLLIVNHTVNISDALMLSIHEPTHLNNFSGYFHPPTKFDPV